MNLQKWEEYCQPLRNALSFNVEMFPWTLIIDWQADPQFNIGAALDNRIFDIVAPTMYRQPRRHKWSKNLNAVMGLMDELYSGCRWIILHDSQTNTYGVWMQHWSEKWAYTVAKCTTPAHAVAVVLLIAQTCDLHGLPIGIMPHEEESE